MACSQAPACMLHSHVFIYSGPPRSTRIKHWPDWLLCTIPSVLPGMLYLGYRATSLSELPTTRPPDSPGPWRIRGATTCWLLNLYPGHAHHLIAAHTLSTTSHHYCTAWRPLKWLFHWRIIDSLFQTNARDLLECFEKRDDTVKAWVYLGGYPWPLDHPQQLTAQWIQTWCWNKRALLKDS
jgi:hypothetical protein